MYLKAKYEYESVTLPRKQWADQDPVELSCTTEGCTTVSLWVEMPPKATPVQFPYAFMSRQLADTDPE